jgi:Uma2 family endonuclease
VALRGRGFVAEVISRDTAAKDFGPKKAGYAHTGVPAYLIADPYQRRCHLCTQPTKNEKDRFRSDYEVDLTVRYGQPIDLSETPAEIELDTEEFQLG